MAHPSYVQKTLVMKPEVTKIFDDLDSFLDFCRFELLPFNPSDLYNRESKIWNHYYSVTYGRKSNKAPRRNKEQTQ
jgi:hypothetical protein